MCCHFWVFANLVLANWAQSVEEFEAFSDSKGIFNLDGDDNKNKKGAIVASCWS